MKFFLLAILLSGTTLAQKNDLTHRPKSFISSIGKAVFVDFISADYEINYDATNKKSNIVATIKFDSPEEGLPVFDSVQVPSSVVIDGQSVSAVEIKTPSLETTVRLINQKVSQGSHTAVIKVPLTTLVDYVDGGVKSAFWTSDLDERRFLERYMPASFEYDQVKMTFMITFSGTTVKQKIYTNGVVTESIIAGKKIFKVNYPDYYNASSIFFHTVPESATEELRFTLKSIDGREIPSVVYLSKSLWGGEANSLTTLKQMATDVFHELEADYGPWLHPSLVIYNAGAGGMEYCGATMTDRSALGHEMFHSYFARGVMPANGNAGWLDEALASWRDDGYQTLSTLSGSSRMSGHPYYTRTTDTAAYSFGERFMSYLDGKVSFKGGLKPFLRHMVENKKFSPLHVEDFIREMNVFYDASVDDDFKKYTFGKESNFAFQKSSHSKTIHKKMSIEELQKNL
jgi:hypothetical protein